MLDVFTMLDVPSIQMDSEQFFDELCKFLFDHYETTQTINTNGDNRTRTNCAVLLPSKTDDAKVLNRIKSFAKLPRKCVDGENSYTIQLKSTDYDLSPPILEHAFIEVEKSLNKSDHIYSYATAAVPHSCNIFT